VAVPEKGAFLDQAGDFDGKWVHTASLAYTDARAKYELGLNLRKGKPATKMTKVELCGEQAVVGGSPAKRCGMSIFARYMFEHRCSVETVSNMRWIARITSHAGGGPVYRCVTRTAHDAAVPGTVRWRWVATDETIWSPCGPGCCRVNTDEF
jgi:hypothetical protein